MFPALSEKILFVDEDGEIYAALPGQDARRLTRESGEIWYACDGVTSVPDLVTALARKRRQPLKETLVAVLDFLSHQSNLGFIEFYTEPHFEDVIAHRLDEWVTTHHL
jgi:hypothetical protein